MEQTVRSAAHTGWREDEIDRLWAEIRQANESGQPLRSVFEHMGQTLGRKPNSVRNYYYMQLRGREGAAVRRAAPFETFSEGEVRALVKAVLRDRARGKSVRASVMALSNGDHARMLRYQNKYRSVLKKRPELIAEICEELKEEGVLCPSVCAAPMRSEEQLRQQVSQKAAALGDPDICAILTGLDTLLGRAMERDPQIRTDRLRVQLDMATLRYDDLSHAAGNLLMLCKEYLGQEEEVRACAMPAFLASLSQCVADVENTMH